MAAYAEETLPAIRAGLPAGSGDDDLFFALFCTPDKLEAMHAQPRDTLSTRELTPLAALLACGESAPAPKTADDAPEVEEERSGSRPSWRTRPAPGH